MREKIRQSIHNYPGYLERKGRSGIHPVTIILLSLKELNLTLSNFLVRKNFQNEQTHAAGKDVKILTKSISSN